MAKFKSNISERFHKMVTSTNPSSEDITAAKQELHITIPSYISSLTVSDFKKKEISDRYVINSVKHMIDKEKKDAEANTPMNKLASKFTKKKMALREVMESAVAGEISPEDEAFLLEALRE